MELKSAIPVGNAGKEWKIVNHIEGMVPKNPESSIQIQQSDTKIPLQNQLESTGVCVGLSQNGKRP